MDDPQSCPRIALYKPTAHGGKVWIGTACASYILVHWGRKDTRGMSKTIPLASVSQSLEALRDRALRKVREGYSLITEKCNL
jgi:hypothetical protein